MWACASLGKLDCALIGTVIWVTCTLSFLRALNSATEFNHRCEGWSAASAGISPSEFNTAFHLAFIDGTAHCITEVTAPRQEQKTHAKLGDLFYGHNVHAQHA